MGESCEVRVSPNGSFNFILYLIIIALMGAGIYFFIKNEEQKRNFKKAFNDPNSQWGSNAGGFPSGNTGFR